MEPTEALKSIILFTFAIFTASIATFTIRTNFGPSDRRILYSLFPLPFLISLYYFLKIFIHNLVFFLLLNIQSDIFISHILITDFDITVLPAIYSIWCKKKYIYFIVHGSIYCIGSFIIFYYDKSPFKSKNKFSYIFLAACITLCLTISMLYMQLKIVDFIYKRENKMEEELKDVDECV